MFEMKQKKIQIQRTINVEDEALFELVWVDNGGGTWSNKGVSFGDSGSRGMKHWKSCFEAAVVVRVEALKELIDMKQNIS